MNINSFRTEPSAVRYIPYSYHITDNIISTVDGQYLAMFKLRGRTHDCASDIELLNWHRDLNQLIKSIGDEHVKLWTHLHHRKISKYPESKFELSFPKMFNDSYMQSFKNYPLMVNDLYLTIIYTPLSDISQKILSFLEKPKKEDLQNLQANAVEKLNEISEQVMGMMRPYNIEKLGIYYRDKKGEIIAPKESFDDLSFDQIDPEGDLLDLPEGDLNNSELNSSDKSVHHAFSSALEWLAYLVNGEPSIQPVCRSRIRSYLMNNRIVSSLYGDVIQLRSENDTSYTAGIEIREYDDRTEPGQLNLLMEADFEFILTQSFSCVSKQTASDSLKRQIASMEDTKDPSQSQIADMVKARDDVVSGRFVMGYHHATLHTYGKDIKVTQKNAATARVMFSQCAINATPIGLASEAAFFARLPSNNKYIPRPALISSENFLCFSPFHNFMSGKAIDNPWGSAVTLFKTFAGSPLFFNFHVTPQDEKSEGKRPNGTTIILGRTGSGKTTLLNALLTQTTKFRPRMFIYDKDCGMMPLVKALKGQYTALKDGVPSGFQPLQMPSTVTNIKFIKRLVKVLAETSLGEPISHFYNEQISSAVDALMQPDSMIPLSARNMTTLCQHIPSAYINGDDKPDLRSLLLPWCRDGQHGWLFDNDTDSLDVSKYDINAFDLTDFIVAKDQPSPAARTPMLMYLQYRIRSSIDGSRHCIQVFDEFAQYLNDPTIETEIQRGVKTDRKKDCIYVFSTQEPNDALDSRIGKTIMQAAVTKILLENPDADPSDYINGLKLTQAEFNCLVNIPENSRRFLVKQGSQSAMAQIKLNNMDKEISILSGTPDNAEILSNIIEELGTDEPNMWMPEFWKTVLREQ